MAPPARKSTRIGTADDVMRPEVSTGTTLPQLIVSTWAAANGEHFSQRGATASNVLFQLALRVREARRGREQAQTAMLMTYRPSARLTAYHQLLSKTEVYVRARELVLDGSPWPPVALVA